MDKATAAVVISKHDEHVQSLYKGVQSTNSTESETIALQKAIDLLISAQPSPHSSGLLGHVVLYTDLRPAIDLFLNTKGAHDQMSSVRASTTLQKWLQDDLHNHLHIGLPPLPTLLRKQNAIKLTIEFLIASPRTFTFENLIILEDEDQGANTSQPASPLTP
ncbi:hypothetical protein AMATHDRAFT_10997 [Amanita thiersii Skay4041]|uniref:Uncharacterized protein n=1 Tax=Amanita thiersii Skay4041 TaxID=703135 RepID=A0A2A9NAF3_9AGAR|nr:hypothetical protein AMATHDRAFT_10997 [Amanita thiersii Skay4041]